MPGPSLFRGGGRAPGSPRSPARCLATPPAWPAPVIPAPAHRRVRPPRSASAGPRPAPGGRPWRAPARRPRCRRPPRRSPGRRGRAAGPYDGAGAAGAEGRARGEPHQLLVRVSDGQAQHPVHRAFAAEHGEQLLREQLVRGQPLWPAGSGARRACADRRVPPVLSWSCSWLPPPSIPVSNFCWGSCTGAAGAAARTDPGARRGAAGFTYPGERGHVFPGGGRCWPAPRAGDAGRIPAARRGTPARILKPSPDPMRRREESGLSCACTYP